MRSLLLLIVLLSIATAIPTGAAPTMPAPGTRIRVTALSPARQRWIGPFVGVARDTVTMRDGEMDGALVVVPAQRIIRFEISRGRHRNSLRGAGEGLAIGALLGAAAGYAAHNDNSNALIRSSTGEDTAAGAVVIGVFGATIGAAIGALTHVERWRALPLESLRGAARP